MQQGILIEVPADFTPQTKTPSSNAERGVYLEAWR